MCFAYLSSFRLRLWLLLLWCYALTIRSNGEWQKWAHNNKPWRTHSPLNIHRRYLIWRYDVHMIWYDDHDGDDGSGSSGCLYGPPGPVCVVCKFDIHSKLSSHYIILIMAYDLACMSLYYCLRVSCSIYAHLIPCSSLPSRPWIHVYI